MSNLLYDMHIIYIITKCFMYNRGPSASYYVLLCVFRLFQLGTHFKPLPGEGQSGMRSLPAQVHGLGGDGSPVALLREDPWPVRGL